MAALRCSLIPLLFSLKKNCPENPLGDMWIKLSYTIHLEHTIGPNPHLFLESRQTLPFWLYISRRPTGLQFTIHSKLHFLLDFLRRLWGEGWAGEWDAVTELFYIKSLIIYQSKGELPSKPLFPKLRTPPSFRNKHDSYIQADVGSCASCSDEVKDGQRRDLHGSITTILAIYSNVNMYCGT